jgi:hypothetical protein
MDRLGTHVGGFWFGGGPVAPSNRGLLHLRKGEYMKAVIPATPLAHPAKLQDAPATCGDGVEGLGIEPADPTRGRR